MLKKKNIISAGAIENDNEIISVTDALSLPAANTYLLYEANHAIYSDPVDLNKISSGNNESGSQESAAFTWQFRKNNTNQAAPLQIQEYVLSGSNTTVNTAANIYKSKDAEAYSSVINPGSSDKMPFSLSSRFSGMGFTAAQEKPYVFAGNPTSSDLQTMVYGTNPSTDKLIHFKTWDQGAPYNDLCPLDPVTKDRCIVGCVATAAAQILYYWQYPKTITFSAADNYISHGLYGDINIQNDAANLDFPTFTELNSYLANIKYDFSDKKEVAALSFAVGIKFEMGYSSYESGAWVIPEPFKNDFGFISAGVINNEYVTSDGITKQIDLTSSTVISVLADNLSKGCPIFTAIRDTASGSGHAVVIDGFRSSDNFFHFNMGWAGADDGWYSLKNVDGFDKIETLVIDLFPTGTLNQTYTVTNTNDYGVGSLRRAIEMANNKTGADTIVFDESLAGKTITLTSGEISITDALNIIGFNKDTITISGGWTGAAGTGSKIFYVSDGDYSSNLKVSMSGLKLTAGYSSGYGGAIYNTENLSLDRLTISDNNASSGGAIFSNSTLTISNSLISGNVAATDGGGIYSLSSLISLNNTIAGNSASVGGGLLSYGSLQLDNTIIADNNAKTNGDIYANANSSSSNNIIGNGGSSGLTNGVNGNQLGTAETPLDPGFVTAPEAGADKIWGTADDIKGNYYIKPDSIAVDAGKDSAVSAEIDLNGNLRMINTVDIGAYEYHIPDMIKPSTPNGTSSSGVPILLDWNDSTDDYSGVKKYQVQVDDYENFKSPNKSLFVNKSEAVISGLNNGTYYWRVRAQDYAGNWSDWSLKDSFFVEIEDTAPPTTPSVLTQTVTGVSAGLDWEDSLDIKSGVKGYEIKVNNNSGSTEQTLTSVDSNITVDFASDGLRYWQVRAQDGVGNWSNWSVASSFSIVIPDILAPTTPAGLKETVTGSAVMLDWNDSADNKSGVKLYKVQVDNNDNFSSPECKADPVVSSVYFSGLGEGTYYWRVQAQDNAGNWSTWSTTEDFAVTMPDIIAPSVPSGLIQTTIQGTAILDWNDSTDNKSGIKRYEVQVDKHRDFLSLDKSTSVTASGTTVTGFSDGNYFWRVRAQDNAGNWSTWSTPTNFTIIVDFVAPSIPTELKPTPGAAGSGSVSMDWKDATDDKSGVKLYSIQIDQNNDFSSPEKMLSSNVSAATVTGLNAGKYYSRVRTQDKAGNFSGWSNSVSFLLTPKDNAANEYKTAKDISTIDNCVGFGDAADFYKLTMTNAGLLTLNLTGLNGDADLSLLDSAGKVLKSSTNKGLVNESIANLALQSGIYYVKVAAADNGKLAANTNYTLTHTEKYYPVDNASNTWQTAKDISTLDNWLGFGDAADFYKLTMTGAGTLTLGLSGLSGDANLTLLNAAGKTLKTSANKGTSGEAITTSILSGTYYVNVALVKGVNSANYMLTHAEKYCPADTAGNTFDTARRITSNGTVPEWLGFSDKEDYYKFELLKDTAIELKLTGLNSDVNLYLYDAGKRQVAASVKIAKADETIAKALKSGTYYVKALLAGKDDTAYSLAFNINPAAIKSGSLQLFSSSTVPGSSSSLLDSNANDPRKNYGMLAS
jgi:hypothetical protein